MKEFDYNLNYKRLKFKPNDKRYRIGRGEQGVLLIRPYTDDICKYWKFKTPELAFESASRILFLYHQYKEKKDFVGMDMCRKFLEMGFTRSRRYANHKDGRIYDEKFNRLPQEPDALTSAKAVSARVFRNARNVVTKDPIYVTMRKQWRSSEQ
tara:strand:- start:34 stop:492 length:459 start_codon:yes stop_codon:yes gene_type:complete